MIVRDHSLLLPNVLTLIFLRISQTAEQEYSTSNSFFLLFTDTDLYIYNCRKEGVRRQHNERSITIQITQKIYQRVLNNCAYLQFSKLHLRK